ncbi:putative PHD finger protein 21A isoform X1 [Apostichopus japonicus]|uniref:Putative PHD finger protein 21A isoform X1 n=1 Tax=Stichopus japonicus TaxID=307972 RepID=A0A2G8L0N9_STIJA|nr:putative PHD finger protein 21A isoform X1 [Apostichopus japonicus]
MANPELQKLQQQLRKEIQSHQILVVKVQSNPNDPDLKKSIKEQQAKIATLSEKQKKVVEQLRSELGIQKSPVQNEKKSSTTMPLGTSQHLNIPTRPSIKITPRPHPAGVVTPPLTPPRMSILTNKPSMFPIKVPQITCRLSGGTTEKKVTMPKLDLSDKKIVKFKEQKHSSHLKPKKALTPAEVKLEFMAALGLITQRTLEHLQNKRQERKRRSTANPQFSSYNRKELESRQSASSYLAATTGSQNLCMIEKEKLIKTNDSICNTFQSHEDACAVCHRIGELLCCDTCRLVYHFECLDPPLSTVPSGVWSCPQCEVRNNKKVEDWKGMVSMVHSFLAHKSRREEEKKKLMQKTADLRNERLALEERVRQLNEAITKKKVDSEELMKSYQKSETAVHKIKEKMAHMNA